MRREESRPPPICIGRDNPYIPNCRSNPDTAINGHRNKPSDPGAVPGASTRARFKREADSGGGETGSTGA